MSNAAHVEVIQGGAESNTYKFQNGWGIDVIDESVIADSINADGTVNTSPKEANSTIDFSAVTADLFFTIKSNGDVVVKEGSSSFSANKVTAKNIANVIGGQGDNVFELERGASLPGIVVGGAVAANGSSSQPANKNNTLDLTNFGALTNVSLAADAATHGTATTTSSAGVTSDIFGGIKDFDTVFRWSRDGPNGHDGANQTLVGTTSADILRGGKQDDSIDGKAGADSIDGGKGADLLRGGSGDDVIDGGSGPDTIYGDADGDTINGGAGADVLDGGDGVDVLNGDGGEDLLIGGAAGDTLKGGSGSDVIVGGAGDDMLEGGRGGDTFLFSDSFGADTVVEQFLGGDDTISFAGQEAKPATNKTPYSPAIAAATVDLTHTYMTNGSLVSSADASNTVTVAAGQAKYIEKLQGGAGKNTYVFQANASGKLVHSLTIDDTTNSGAAVANGTLDFSDISADLTFTIERIGVDTSGDDIVRVLVRDGSNVLTRNTITATGIEKLIGGKGNNSYVIKNDFTGGPEIVGGPTGGQTGFNTLDYSDYEDETNGLGVTVDLSGTFAATGTATGTAAVSRIHHVIGSSAADTITGNDAANTITGGKGNDVPRRRRRKRHIYVFGWMGQ